ncbi:MAG TPA: DUF4412 domain-containing protein [Bacteroidia bacterium]|jgi:GLPGLI family protein|nr:DUF4412 domain-containing protein [Bacteroidia bacterium]
MNNTFRRLALSAALLTTTLFAQAQKNFEGSMVFTMDISGEGLPPEAKQMMEGSEMRIYMKAEKCRIDMKMAMQNTITLSDAKAKSSYVLMDMMGQKIKMITTPDLSTKQPDVTVKETTETKEIAGYKCKKAEVTAANQEPIIVYYTEEIANNGFNTQVKGIKGYPLQFETTQGGMKISYTAKTVTKEKIDDSKFVVDDKEYKVMTREELMKSMGGGGH